MMKEATQTSSRTSARTVNAVGNRQRSRPAGLLVGVRLGSSARCQRPRDRVIRPPLVSLARTWVPCVPSRSPGSSASDADRRAAAGRLGEAAAPPRPSGPIEPAGEVVRAQLAPASSRRSAARPGRPSPGRRASTSVARTSTSAPRSPASSAEQRSLSITASTPRWPPSPRRRAPRRRRRRRRRSPIRPAARIAGAGRSRRGSGEGTTRRQASPSGLTLQPRSSASARAVASS